MLETFNHYHPFVQQLIDYNRPFSGKGTARNRQESLADAKVSAWQQYVYGGGIPSNINAVYVHYFAVAIASQVCEVMRNSEISEPIAIQGYPRQQLIIWSLRWPKIGANRKRMCNFLLVISIKFGRDIDEKAIENSSFSNPMHPCLMSPLRRNPLEFLNVTYPAKTRGWVTLRWKLYNPNFEHFWLISHSTYVIVTDGRIDGRTGDSI